MSRLAKWTSVLAAVLLAAVLVGGPILLVRQSRLTSGPRLSAADVQAIAEQPAPTASPPRSSAGSSAPTRAASGAPRSFTDTGSAATASASDPESSNAPTVVATPTPSAVLTSPSGSAPIPATISTTPVPVSLDVSAIGVHTTLESLGLDASGQLQAPTQWQQAGWYSLGIRPGDPGPAVIAGHVDSTNGPAVFYNLRNLVDGDTAVVTRADGSQLTFVVENVVRYPKNQFPTQLVYGPTAVPELRLITCTGDFDRSLRSYVDNLVVALRLQS